MATTAVQVGTTSAQLAAANSDGSVTIQNLGPNPIYIQQGSAATIAGGFPIASGAVYNMEALEPVNAICSVLQVSPNDTRVSVERLGRD